MPTSSLRPSSKWTAGKSTWDLRWTVTDARGFFSQYFIFPKFLPFQQRSVQLRLHWPYTVQSTVWRLRCRFQRPRGLRCKCAATRLLRWWVRILPGPWTSVCRKCSWFDNPQHLRSLRRADHWSRGVLTTVVLRCVWSRNLMNEEAMAGFGPQRHRKIEKVSLHKPLKLLKPIYRVTFILRKLLWPFLVLMMWITHIA